jgi:shikimate dehydrogenase
LQSLKVLNIAGANIAVPYKEAVIPYLDILSEGANIIGAINTIVINGEELKGYNTNAIGFMDAMSSVGYDIEGKSTLVIGTGGAARAVVFVLNWMRTRSIIVAGRNKEKTRELVNKLGGDAKSLQTLSDHPLPVDLIVNATSVSSNDEAPELAALVQQLDLPNCDMIVDLNYDRLQNFWYDLALAKGIRFMDGLTPLAYQARRTFSLWTGLQVPPENFLQALGEA